MDYTTLAYAQGESDNIGGMPSGEGMSRGGGMSEDEVGKTEDLENETGGMTESQTDPNGEEQVDLGTEGP
jgi:hypothetical protein